MPCTREFMGKARVIATPEGVTPLAKRKAPHRRLVTSPYSTMEFGGGSWMLLRLKSVSLRPHAREALLPEHSNMEYAPRSADTAFNALLASGSVVKRPGPAAGRGRDTTGAYPVGCPVPIASVIDTMASDAETAHAITWVLGIAVAWPKASCRSTTHLKR
jgi:hypothetical protein